MSMEPNFGPGSSWESIASFEAISEKAFTLFEKRTQENWEHLSKAVHHLFLRMEYQAKTTSFGLRLINSWAMSLPAFALTRIRLEQTIVCSYLLHEDESVGLGPFVQYIPVTHHQQAKAAMQDPDIARLLSKTNFSGLEAEAIQAQEAITPGFSLEKDKFQRNWTKLDLRSMAKKRDSLVKAKYASAQDSTMKIMREPLERDYLTIYKVASSIVHADGSSLSYHFLNLFQIPPGPRVLMAKPSWAIISVAGTAHYDVLQCYEILEWLGLSAEEEYKELMHLWIEARNKYIS